MDEKFWPSFALVKICRGTTLEFASCARHYSALSDALDWGAPVTEAAVEHLEASCKDAKDWRQALDAYEGIHAIPLMTIHKSKSLEYHTVIFVGLDDDAWFAFKRQTVEETCGFFVAFTRAKQRVVFTYCAARGQRTTVAPLYTLLKSAGVQTVSR